MATRSLRGTKKSYGVVVDIGSGSVLVAIVESDPKATAPTIIWAHRERAPLKHIDSLQESAKGIVAALVDAAMKLDGEGRIALQTYSSRATLTTLQVAISAPWCYTVTKSISYRQDEPFTVTDELISELVATAERQVTDELGAHQTTAALSITPITRALMDMTTNGYRVTSPDGANASAISVTEATVVAQTYLVDAVAELHRKLFSRTKKQQTSFMLQLYCAARHLLPHTDDTCLIDITYEATEMGVVRDGCLRYSTHTAFGLYSLTREIATITNQPLPHVLSQLRQPDPTFFLDSLSAEKRTEVETSLEAYVDKIASLFHETGDTLSIPKKILLHMDNGVEPFFQPLIERAAKKATKIDHALTSVATAVGIKNNTVTFTDTTSSYQSDTALALLAQFFHKPEHCLDFTYL